jgi:putative restriction endonuclease
MADRIFGHIPGVPVGTLFASRQALREAGVHSQNMAGISGSQPEGADAIVISGGYEDDEDWGTEVIYTGQGGRDQETGKQVEDQTLTRGNLGLVITRNKGLPLRVIRKVDDEYRYDGLYRVADAWHETGKSGMRVWRYRLTALEPFGVPREDGAHLQTPLDDAEGRSSPSRKTTTVSRVIRDTRKSRELKERYQHTCQVCSIRLVGVGGPYAEAAHVRPLGKPHDGPDTFDNLVCLCPNHHALFDMGGFRIADDLSLIGIDGILHVHPTHILNRAYLKYHRDHYSPEE